MSISSLPRPPAELRARVALRTQNQSTRAQVWRRFKRHRMAMLSLCVLAAMFAVALLAPWIAPYDRNDNDITRRFLPPLSADPGGNAFHIFGTDRLGRDLFTRIIFGIRITLGVALITTTLRTLLGTLAGTLAGFYRGRVDAVVQRVIEFVSLLPDFPILLILASILIKDPRLLPIPTFAVNGLSLLMNVNEREGRVIAALIFVLVVLGWTGSARLMRAQVLSMREREYVDASRSLGANDLRLMLAHLVPNAFPPLIVSFSLGLSGALATETAFSFLGVGITEPTPTLGNILSAANSDILLRWWLPLIPCIPVFLSCVAFNFIGDGLRDALDPRNRR